MTKEELQEFLKDENNKAIFDETVKAMGYESQDDILGLKNKNEQLLVKMKKRKEDFEEKQKLLDSIDIDAYNEYVNGEGDKNKGSSELNKTKRDLKEAQNNLEKLNKIESDYNNTLKLNAVKDALIDNKIDLKHASILTSAFISKAKVEIDGDDRNIIIDDDGLGLPPKEFFKKWTETETGKAYLAKPENVGSGTTGFATGGSVKKMKISEFNALPNSERSAVSKDAIAGKIKLED